MDNRPIGVFDSGVGGLTVWARMTKDMPAESFVYLGDGENYPYGEKSKEQVRGFLFEAADKLIRNYNIKMLVVACNTATIAGIEELRLEYPDLPIVGMEPAIKPAAASTLTGQIGVLATRSSLAGEKFQQTLSTLPEDIKVWCVAGEDFVEIVEENIEDTAYACEMVGRVMSNFAKRKIDKLVLGCTHYPFLRKSLQFAIGNKPIELIDSASAISRRVAALLEENNICADPDKDSLTTFISFAGRGYAEKLQNKSEVALAMAE